MKRDETLINAARTVIQEWTGSQEPTPQEIMEVLQDRGPELGIENPQFIDPGDMHKALMHLSAEDNDPPPAA